MASLRYPVAVWQDAEGSFTGCTLAGRPAAAIDRSVKDVLAQLTKYLTWLIRQGEDDGSPDLDDLSLAEFRVPVRPRYECLGTVDALEPFPLRIIGVLGRRSDGQRQCVLPTIGRRFAYHDDSPLPELVAETVQQALSDATPQALSRVLSPPALRLEKVFVREQLAASALAPRHPVLESLAEQLGQRRQAARFGPAHLRGALVQAVAERLGQATASILLVGESGVGKTAVMSDAVRLVVRTLFHAAPDASDDDDTTARRQFWLTSGARIIAGMKYLGQWEERVELLIDELAETGSVLCVESLLALARLGAQDPSGSIAAFLIPYLERGELRLVAEATPAEVDACRRLLPGLVDPFQIVRVPNFTPTEARGVLDLLLAEGARQRKIELAAGIGDVVYRLFARFQPYAAFPGRCAVFLRRWLAAAAEQGVGKLTPTDVLTRFQRETGLPERLLRDDIPLPYAEILGEFQRLVLGQEAACQAAAALVARFKSGLHDPRRPLGVMLFCGPTGVGKTEMAKALARYLFGASGAKDRLIRLDMSEYSGYGAAERLLMKSDGRESDFIQRVRRQPFVVVLFDEIEKAAPDVLDALLGLLDEGRLSDRFGRTTTFASAAIVMTSNLGADRAASIGYEAGAPAFERIAMQTFRPEFFNRIDSVVSFAPLTPATIRALAERELCSIREREGLVKSGLKLVWDPAVITRLAEVGFDARYGARPLQRAMETQVVAPLSAWLLEHRGVRDRTLRLVVKANGSIGIGE